MSRGEAVATGSIVGQHARPPRITCEIPEWLHVEGLPCRDADADAFFPPSFGKQHTEQIDEARRICEGCPALAECLAWAVDHPDLDGVWAATTPPERRRLRRQQKEHDACT